MGRVGEEDRSRNVELSPFLNALLVRHTDWRNLPVVERRGHDWNGAALIVPPPSGSDLFCGLDIEEVDGEVTISLDYSHIHMAWPPRSGTTYRPIWTDATLLIQAILDETVVATSGWIDGALRVGSLHEVDREPDLLVPRLQRLRVRSWRGTFDRDEVAAGMADDPKRSLERKLCRFTNSLMAAGFPWRAWHARQQLRPDD